MFGINSLLGLPLHVLIVHFAVVLVPLAAATFLIAGARQKWRANYSVFVAVLAVGGAAAAFIAAQSGGSLRRSLREKALNSGTRPDFGGHPGNGNQAEIVALLFAVAAVAMWLASKPTNNAEGQRSWRANTVYVLGSVLSILAIVTMTIAGHSGAALVWKDLGNYVTKP